MSHWKRVCLGGSKTDHRRVEYRASRGHAFTGYRFLFRSLAAAASAALAGANTAQQYER